VGAREGEIPKFLLSKVLMCDDVIDLKRDAGCVLR